MAPKKLTSVDTFCKQCAQPIFQKAGKGAAKLFCSTACAKEAWPKCSADGCERKARSRHATKCNTCYLHDRKKDAGQCIAHKCTNKISRRGAGLCEAHYYRLRRTGSLHKDDPSFRYVVEQGYIRLFDPKHPLASKGGYVLEHRAVAYRSHNATCPPCYWCGRELAWSEAVVDHLNDKKADNRPQNLVVSCSPCNRLRGFMMPFLDRMTPAGRETIVEYIRYRERGKAQLRLL